MSEECRVESRFILSHRRVEADGKPLDVYGMGRFRVRPRHLGVGTHLIRAMEEIARRDGKACLIAFCDDSLLDFYIRKCGWHAVGRQNGKTILSSIPFTHVVVTEEW